MTTTDPESLVHCAERVVNGKTVFHNSLHDMKEAARNREVLDILVANLSEDERLVVMQAVEIVGRKYKIPSLPPPPPDQGPNTNSEPPGSDPQAPSI